MDDLLPLSSLSDEKMVLFNKVVLDTHERLALVKFIADELTIEAMDELFYEVVQETEKCPESTLYDKILWVSRSAYLAGIERGVRNYSNLVEIALRKA